LTRTAGASLNSLRRRHAEQPARGVEERGQSHEVALFDRDNTLDWKRLLAQSTVETTKPAITQKAVPPRLDRFGDPLPAGAIARLGTVRFRHNGTINCFIFSPDGKIIASCSGGTIHLWDVATGREVWHVGSDSTEHETVSTLAFSRDGKQLACGGQWTATPFGFAAALRISTFAPETLRFREPM
jgi:WD40 repeat protein